MRSPILGGFSTSRSTNLADAEAYNLLVEIVETKDGKAPGALWLAPGLDLLATVGEGPIRGLHAFQGLLYLVSGSSVYSITPNWVSTLLGTISSATTPVSIQDNGTGGQVAFSDGTAMYIAPGGNPLTGGSIGAAGTEYAVGDTITLTPVSGFQTVPAILTVTTVGAGGAVTGFSVTQGGSFNPEPASFTQNSTSGSGANFTLVSPAFGAFQGITTVNLPFIPTGQLAIIDGFGLSWEANTNKLWQSNELDLSTWDPLDFDFLQAKPDNGSTVIAIHDEVYALKQTSTEIWVDGGTAGFAFAPEGNGTVLQVGCIAPFSACICGETFIFLSQNDQGQALVIEMRGYEPHPVSTQALVNELQTYATISDAIGYSYQQGGHVYYILVFPSADKTWCYDLTASALAGYPIWTRRAAFSNGQWHRHWGNAFARFLGAGSTETTTSTYCATPVVITSPTELTTPSGLGGLGTSFSTAVLSVWLDIPDSGTSAFILSDQTDDTHGTTNPGIFIKIGNDNTTSPQITIEAWDASNAIIVSATYDFTTWATWVNILMSIDTTTQTLQVYANTIVSGALVETKLTPSAIVWGSTNPIGVLATQPWHLVTADS